MNYVVGALTKHGAQAVRVFPHDSQVLFLFADRLANEVVSRVRRDLHPIDSEPL